MHVRKELVPFSAPVFARADPIHIMVFNRKRELCSKLFFDGPEFVSWERKKHARNGPHYISAKRWHENLSEHISIAAQLIGLSLSLY